MVFVESKVPESSPSRTHAGRVRDARGRQVTQLDPVRMHLLAQPGSIAPETLRRIADEIMPGARRQGMLQILSVLLGLTVVIGGTIVYFTYFSTWKGFDPVSITIHVIQLVVILSGPYIAYRMARSKYFNKVGEVMRKYRHCPHCGYNLRGLPVDPGDGATVCPECGAAWMLAEEAA